MKPARSFTVERPALQGDADVSGEKALLTIGVVSDTHIPDRVSEIPEEVLARLHDIGVGLIFHAGDISVLPVITALEKIAPVKAVRGNRDFLLLRRLPHEHRLDLAGIPFVLTHGHGGWGNYVLDKFRYIFQGYSFPRYHKLLARHYPAARVIVYGHTHFAENRWVGDQLFFNPGSCTLPAGHRNPSFGVLRVYEGGRVSGEIHRLEGEVRTLTG